MQRCEADVRKLCGKSNVLKAATFSGGSIRSAGEAMQKWLDEVISVKPAALSAKERSIAAISMYTARGDMENLKTALNAIGRLKDRMVSPDMAAQSGLKWSNPASGTIDIAMGTICTADIVVEKCRPYEWLF